MLEPRKNGGRTARGTFAKGNPGRPKGAKNRVGAAMEKMLDGKHRAITKRLIELALSGDTTALRLCIERLLPPRRDNPVSIELPELATLTDAQSILAAGQAVIHAVASGGCTPDEGGKLMGLLAQQAKLAEAIETADLARRLDTLEAERRDNEMRAWQ